MIEPEWPRIAGIHVEDTGAISCVWIAHDKDADRLTVYDAHTYRTEVLAAIAEGIKGDKGRRKWIPVAWHEEAKEIADRLLDRGVSILHEPVKDNEAVAEVVSREIDERMLTGRFIVARAGLDAWHSEFDKFGRQDHKVPRKGFPLMSATRHAVAMLEYARKKGGGSKINYPKIALV